MVTQNTTTAGAASAARHIQLTEPQANQQIVIDNIAGAALDMAFPSEAAQLEQSGQDLVFLFENGGRIVLSNFFGLFESNQLPAFTLEDGQSLPGDAFLAALREDLLPAAGPGGGAGAAGGGVGDYADDPGSLIGGVDRLDPLGTTTFGVTPLATIEDDATPLIDTIPTLVMTTSALTVYESNLGDGSSTYQGTTEGPIGVSGSFAITAPDGIGSLTVGNSVFTAAQLAALAGGTPLTVDLGAQDAYADMVLTGFDGTNVFFTYTLVDDSTHTLLTPSAEDRIETVGVTITDTDGDVATGILTITIADDEPFIGKINNPNPEDEVTPDDYPELGTDGVVEHVFTNGEFNLHFDLTNGGVSELDNGIVDLRVNGGTPFFRSGAGLGVTYDGNQVPGDSPDRENELGHRDDKLFHEQEGVVFKLDGVADSFHMGTSAFYSGEGGSGEIGKVLFFLGDELVDSRMIFANQPGDSYNFSHLNNGGLFDRVVIIGLDYQHMPSFYGSHGHDTPSVGDSSDFYITNVGFHLVSEVGVAHGDLDFTYGADDRGSFDLSFAGVSVVVPEGGSEGGELQAAAAVESPSEIWTTDGHVVNVVTTAEGLVVGFIGDAPESLEDYANATSALAQSNVAFVLSVDPDTGYWTFTQKALLDLPDDSGGTLHFNYTITDGDGDTASSSFNVQIIEAERTPDIDMPTEAHVVHESGLFTPFAVGTEAGHEDVVATGTFVIDMQHEDFSAITMAGKHFDNLDALRDGGLLFIGENGLAVDNPLHAHAALDVTGYTFDATTGKYTVSYTYVLYDNVDHTFPDGTETGDVIPVSVTDASGDSAYASLTITIVDDHPIAHDNVAWVTEDGGRDHNPFTDDEASGNVITGNIFWLPELGDDQQGADGAKVSNIKFGFHSEGVDANGEHINGLYGTLFIKADGSYTYELNNGNDAVQHLIPGETLKEVFTYTLKDGDGDTDTAKLTITINGANDRVEIGCINSLHVNEDDLPWGSDVHKESLTDYGQFIVTANDGLDVVKINGESVVINGHIQADHTIDTPYGNLVVYDVDYLGDGKYRIEYKFTLDDNAHHANGNGENDFLLSLGLAVSDRNGDWDTASINVHITDDVPTAYDNYATVTEDGGRDHNPFTDDEASGNVITGNLFHVPEFGDDVQGADGAKVSNIQFGAHSEGVDNNGEFINGLYGKLFIKADGSYTYELNNGNDAVQHLIPGETLKEVFTYTLKDGDGDTDTAKLTITINGANDKVEIGCINSLHVNEDDLPFGSDFFKESLTDSSSFIVTANDGLNIVQIGGENVIVNGVLQADHTIDTPYGNLVVTGVQNLGDGQYKISYSFTLDDNAPHANGNGENDYLLSLGLKVIDRKGDYDTDTLKVHITDDVPTAHDNYATVTEDGGHDHNPFTDDDASGNVITGNIFWLNEPGDDVQGADGAKVSLIKFGGHSEGVDNNGEAINGLYGTLFIKADGSYTYTLNNSNAAVQHLIPGEHLQEVFTYTLKDGDGDTDTAKLTITIDGANDKVEIGCINSLHVNEDDLPWGSDIHKESLTDSSSFIVNANDGLDTLKITLNGVTETVFDHGVLKTDHTFDSPYGNLVITGVQDIGNGNYKVSYKFTLDDNAPHAPIQGENDYQLSFDVKAIDRNGDDDSGTIKVHITDDVPTAHDNYATVTEDGGRDHNPFTDDEASGNVITGNLFHTPEFGDDVQGADGAKVSDIKFGFHSEGVGNHGEHINGLYGTLFIKPDGSYTYELNNHNDKVQHLIPGEHLQEVFTYTLKDGDGDTDTANLTITINGADDKVDIGCINSLHVNEDDLPLGSDIHKESLTDTDSFIVSANDGLGLLKLSFGGATETVYENGALKVDHTLDTPLGGMTITHVEDLGHGRYEVFYSFTLADNASHYPGFGENDKNLPFGVEVVDRNGSSDSGTINVHITDDVPTANPNTAEVYEDGTLTAIGNLITDAPADVEGADAPLKVIGIKVGTGIGSYVEVDADGTDIETEYGTLHVEQNGHYTYTLNNNASGLDGLDEGSILPETFKYMVVDTDGDISKSTLTVDVHGANEAQDLFITGLEGTEINVNESGLSPDGSGTPPTDIYDHNSFTVTATDGLDSLSIDSTPVVQGGVLPGAPITIGTPNGDLVVEGVTNNGDGTYTVNYHFTLDTAANHALPNGGSLSFTVTANDTDPHTDAATGTVNINIVDDHPTAVDDVASYPKGITTNVVIVLDSSGSMDDNPDGPGGYATRFDLAKAAIAALLEKYDDVGQVNVRIIDFDDDTRTSSWFTGDGSTVQAMSWVNTSANSSIGGGTYYDDAIDAAKAVLAGGLPSADKSVVYFLSDGDPNSGHGLSTSDEPAWINALTAAGVDTVYAFGMGEAVSATQLDRVAWDAHGADTSEVISNLTQLPDVLLGTVSTEGNLFANDTAGADGGMHVDHVTLMVDGVLKTYTFDVDAQANAAHKVAIDLGENKGILTLDFDDGSYEFVPGSKATGEEILTYTVEDADGTQSTATLLLRLPMLDAHDNHAITGNPTFQTVSTDDFTETVTHNWLGYTWTTEEPGYDGWSNTGGATLSSESDTRLLLNLNTDSGAIVSSKTFTNVSAGDTLEFDWRTVVTGRTGVSDNHDPDKFVVVIDGVEQPAVYAVSAGSTGSSGTFTYTFLTGGPHTVQIKAVDGVGGNGTYASGNRNNGLQVYIDDVTIMHAAAAIISGDVIHDHVGTDVADQLVGMVAHVTEVNGHEVTATGLSLDTTYGHLDIHQDGTYTYTAKVGMEGHDDTFVYKLSTTEGGGQEDYATLNVHLGDRSTHVSVSDITHTLNSDDNHFYQGGTGGDTIHGTDGNDVIFGHDGVDYLYGGEGDDYLHGGAGDDHLFGDGGNDILVGGQGGDTLTGGTGADTFMWSAEDFTAGAKDVVTDFHMNTEHDVLKFSDVLIGTNPDVVAGGNSVLAGTDSNDVVITLHHGAQSQYVVLQDALSGAPDTSAALQAIEQHILNHKIITENS
ncbi:VCBS domain-containing protein [Nitratidesulfovibrio termitidis]|uniref:VCBS domain-containing protein n=1 Tax=Nitratidesulfovibrio termitidis TaxID=42252 RepID=UPI00040E2671|nr:VCBS domain-containing protein [Nitratidesulfovibrio termitidis]